MELKSLGYKQVLPKRLLNKKEATEISNREARFALAYKFIEELPEGVPVVIVRGSRTITPNIFTSPEDYDETEFYLHWFEVNPEDVELEHGAVKRFDLYLVGMNLLKLFRAAGLL